MVSSILQYVFWDLRFQKSQISPDYLLTNGDDSHEKALNFGYDRDELIKVESLRYKNTKKPLFNKYKILSNCS